MKTKKLFSCLLAAMLFLSVISAAFAAEKLFALSVYRVKCDDAAFEKTEETINSGETVCFAVEYAIPHSAEEFSKAKENIDTFLLSFECEGMENVKLKSANTLICDNGMCSMNDTLDILKYTGTNVTLKYGYSGTLIFEGILKGSIDELYANVTVSYGEYFESASYGTKPIPALEKEPSGSNEAVLPSQSGDKSFGLIAIFAIVIIIGFVFVRIRRTK